MPRVYGPCLVLLGCPPMTRTRILGLAALAALGLACSMPADDDGKARGTDDDGMGQPAAAATAASTVAAPPTPTGPATTITDGTWTVGVDIVAGKYRVVGAGANCYWSITTSGTNGSDIVDNAIGGGNLNVTLKAGQDFETKRCGTWSKVG